MKKRNYYLMLLIPCLIKIIPTLVTLFSSLFAPYLSVVTIFICFAYAYEPRFALFCLGGLFVTCILWVALLALLILGIRTKKYRKAVYALALSTTILDFAAASLVADTKCRVFSLTVNLVFAFVQVICIQKLIKER